MVQRAGFDSACRVRHAVSSRRENRYALSRIVLTDDITEEGMDNLLSDAYLPIAPPPDRLISAGHDVNVLPDAYSDTMGHAGAVVIHPGGALEGAHDPRADGGAAGL